VRGDDPDDGVADLAVRQKSQPGLSLARIRVVRHSQVSAEHIDAGLPVLLPVIG